MESAREAVENNAASAAAQGRGASNRRQAECQALGLSTQECNQYHSDQRLEKIIDVAMFFVPTEPYEIVLLASGSGYAIRQGGKLISRLGRTIHFESKADAERAVRAAVYRGGKACSFHGDMLIPTIAGYKPIRNISIGDWVLSKHETTGQVNYQQVLDQYNNHYQQTVYIHVVDNQGKTHTIISNKIHPFFVQRNDDISIISSSEGHVYQGDIPNAHWIDASNLKTGDKLLSEDGSWQTVQSIKLTGEPLLAYNLTINHNHTYFVSGTPEGKYQAFGVWVHNDCSALINIRSYVTPTGRLHRDGDELKREFLSIGYNKQQLLEAKAILERSIADRKSDKEIYGVLDYGHKRRIALEEDILNRINNKLKEFQ